jgi:hypothetical protein
VILSTAHRDKIFVIIFLITIVCEYVFSPREVFYLFYDLWSLLVIQVVVFQPGLFLLAGFPTVPLGFGVHVVLQCGFFFVSMFFGLLYRILCKMDILIATWLSPAARAVSMSSPGCSPWHAWTETWPIVWPMWIGETHLPVVYAWMEGAIAPWTAAGPVPRCAPANPSRQNGHPGHCDNLVGMSHLLDPDGLDCNKLAT